MVHSRSMLGALTIEAQELLMRMYGKLRFVWTLLKISTTLSRLGQVQKNYARVGTIYARVGAVYA